MASSIAFHRMLLNDAHRMQAYRQAISQTVQPGDVVLDLGTGSGVLAFFACQAGAARVYAVDKTDALILAQQLAHDHGLAERITFIRQDIRDIHLPEPVDVIVSELISKGVLGQQQETLISLARDRFLKPNGRLLPQWVDLWMAPVEVEAAYKTTDVPPLEAYDLDFARLRQLSVNHTSSTRLCPKNLLSPAQRAYRHDAAHVTAETHADATLTFTAERVGTLHGFGGWFEATLAADVVLTNAPSSPSLPAWDHLWLPAAEPVAVEPGMTITLHLRGTDTPRQPRFWLWTTTVTRVSADNGEPQVVARYQQSTFFGKLWTPDLIGKRAKTHVPTLGEEGKIDGFILALMDGERPLEAIARKVAVQFPAQFATVEEALARVAELSAQYSV